MCVDTRSLYRSPSPQMRERKICAFALMSLLSLSASSATAPSTASQVSEADKLKQQVNELYNAGKYSEAISIATRLVELRERALGPEHPDTATSLNNLAVLYYQLEHLLERNNARPTSESAASPQKNPGVRVSTWSQ
jgi:hypothetical protein